MIENIAAKYDKGLKKEQQEDKAFAEEINASDSLISALLMVADGWGSNAGEIPLSYKVESLLKDLFIFNFYQRLAEKNHIFVKNLKEILNLTYYFIDAQLKKSNYVNSGNEMGTTCTIALVLKSPPEFTNVLIGHVGDSRAYVISPKKIKLLTADDSLVWQYYVQGKINYKDIPKHVDRHFLTQALGCGTLTRPQIIQAQIKNDETLLLCSDGLYGNVSEKKIKNIINSTVNLSETIDKLIYLANKKGGTDNISVAVYSRKTDKKKKSLISLIMVISPIFLVAILLWNLIFNSSDKFVNGSDKGTKQLIQQNRSDFLKNKTNKIEASDFDVVVPVYLSYRNEHIVEIFVTYRGKLKNKMFLLKVNASNKPGNNPVQFNNRVSYKLKLLKEGNNQIEVTISDMEGNVIYYKIFNTFVQEYKLVKPILKLTVLTLKILNFDLMKNEIESINWMEGADNSFRPPTDKYVYKSSKVIPNKIKIKYKNGNVEDFQIQ